MANTDSTLVELIERTRRAATLAERNQAFGEIVHRFQDLAVASAYARLGDFALAEDAAQEAFLLAWERLDQLREPAAFPGWLQRIVRSQCHRRLRGTRLELLPLDAARDVAAGTDAASDLVAADEAKRVGAALSRLGSSDRLVLVLFYGSGRSHAEIANWLGVPVTTVSRRLAHAKHRLRERMLEALSAGLRAQRRVAGENFVLELSARIRPVDASDVGGLLGLAARLGLDRPPHMAPPTPPRGYLVEDPVSGLPVAYAAAAQSAFAPLYSLHLAMGEDALTRHAGDVLLAQVMQDLVAAGAIAVRHQTSARHRGLVEFLTARGFAVVERAQDWRLDAADFAPEGTSTRQDWEAVELEALWREPALFDATLELLNEAMGESPTERAFRPIHPAPLQRVLRRQRHGVVAVAGGTIQGLVTSRTDDLLPEAARLDLVVVRKNRRGQGLATAMLARLLAREGCSSVRYVAPASHDRTGWLTRCGFAQVADTLLLERLLRPTVQVAHERLDEYVGRYVVEAMPRDPIFIERHGDFLISKARDMRDVLLAASDSEFFTRNHYGHGRFERDPDGRVVRLVYHEGPRELVATRG